MIQRTLIRAFDELADTPDGVAKLRELVFQCAVQGRLSPQSSSDAPDNFDLLGERKAPRAQPTGRVGGSLEEVTSDEISDPIPKSWAWVRLFKLCAPDAPIVYGILQPGPNVRPNGVPYVRPTEIKGHSIRLAEIRHTTPEIAAQYTRSVIRAGDVLLTIVGTLGAVAVVPKELDGGNITQSSCRLRPDANFINTAYLLICLRSPILLKQYLRFSLGSAVQRLNIAHVRALAIPLPPLAEQARIVAKVDELMALCDALEARQTTRSEARRRLHAATLHQVTAARSPAELAAHWSRLRTHFDPLHSAPDSIPALRQTILSLAVQGRIGECDPSAWPRQTLRSLAVLITSGSRGWAEYYSADGPLFVRAQNVKRNGRLLLDDVAHVRPPPLAEGARTRIQVNDVLVVITGAGVSQAARVTDDIGEAYISQHVALVRLKEPASAPWLDLQLHAVAGCLGQLAEFIYGAKPGLNLDNLRNLELSLPPLAEQKRIVTKVEQLLALCDELETRLKDGDARRERLLTAAIHDILQTTYASED